MDYKRMEQSSRLYKYGRNEEFETKQEAVEAIEKLKQNVIMQLKLYRIYDKSELEIIEIENAFQLVVSIKFPNLFSRI